MAEMLPKKTVTAIEERLLRMIDKLTVEKQLQIEKKDFCVDEINRNERETDLTSRDHQEAKARYGNIGFTIDGLERDIEDLRKQMHDAMVELKRAGEERRAQNNAFLFAITDQRDAQQILGTALARLQSFNGAHQRKAAMLRIAKAVSRQIATRKSVIKAGKILEATTDNLDLQSAVARQLHPKWKASLVTGRRVTSSRARAPRRLQEYEPKAMAPVIMMIEKLVQKSRNTESAIVKGEEEAENTYGEFTRDFNGMHEFLSREIIEKQREVARTKLDHLEAAQEEKQLVANLGTLRKEDIDLHGMQGCDWLAKNFDIIQQARDEEVEGLKISLWQMKPKAPNAAAGARAEAAALAGTGLLSQGTRSVQTFATHAREKKDTPRPKQLRGGPSNISGGASVDNHATAAG